MKHALVAAAILALAGCTAQIAKDPNAPPDMTKTVAPAEMVQTSGTAPNLYITCWREMMFMPTNSNGGVIQVMAPNGKPMEC